MKLLTENSITGLLKLFKNELVRKNEILTISPTIQEIRATNGLAQIPELHMDMYTIVTGNVAVINIDNIIYNYSHKELTSYVQFVTGEVRPTININDNVLWTTMPELKTNSIYMLEIHMRDGLYFAKLDIYE